MQAQRVNWDAHSYEEVAQPQLKWGRALLGMRSWRGDEHVLDAGCGTGALAEELLARVPRGRVTAVDVDPSMVEAARKRLAKDSGRARVVQSDLTTLEGVGPVDVIYSNAVLHWIPDHDEILSVFLRHLRPGGEILVSCGGEGNLDRIRGAARATMESPAFKAVFSSWVPPWRYEDDSSTTERLYIAGFRDAQVALVPTPTAFPDAASFEKFVRIVALRPYLQRLPDGASQDSFVADFMRRIAADGGGFTLDYVRLTFRARRPNA